MADRITRWLEEIGLGEHAKSFVENDIDVNLLTRLSAEDLKELGLSIGHRRRFLDAVAKLKEAASEDAGISSPSAPHGEAERRQLTVMFCDLVGSTALSQRLDPEDLSDIVRAYQKMSAARIEHFAGYVARYMGDGVLAYFGYPRADEDDPVRAVHAALALVDAVVELDATLGRKNGVELAVRVGIATGPVVVGHRVGEGDAQERTVVGETPNLAARLQSIAAPNSIVVTERTHRLTEQHFIYRGIGETTLKGIDAPVHAWQVVGARPVHNRFDASRRTTLTPIVGREDEIYLLEKRWSRARAGEGQVVMLSGEAGIGKSRLVSVMQERAARDTHELLCFPCSPHHTNSALHPIISHLEHDAGFADEDSAETRREKLAALLDRSAAKHAEQVQLIAELLSIASDAEGAQPERDPAGRKEKMLAALLTRVEAVATRPVLCIFEDVHWIDPSTMEFLDRLVERVQALPVMLVITFRTDFEPPWTGQPHVTYLAISRMDRRNTLAVVDGITDGKKLPDDVLEQIVLRTDGVPLFIEELTKTVLESDVVVDRGERYELVGPLATLDIPITLQDSLMARLDRLGDMKEVAQIGAAIGREFSYDLLTAVASDRVDDLAKALDALVESQLLFRRGSIPNSVYTFKHGLVQEAAYASLLRKTRQQYHTRIAEALERQFSEVAEHHPELLAHHHTQALAPEKAVKYWRIAGRRASARSAHIESINHVTAGLETLKQLPESAESQEIELDLQMLLGGSTRATRGYAAHEVESAFSRAKDLCNQIGNEARLFEAIWGLWLHHLVRANLDTAYELAQQAYALASQRRDPVLLMEAYIATGVTLFQRGELVMGYQQLESCVEIYEHEKHAAQAFLYGQDPGVFALSYLAWGSWFFGFPDRSVTQIEKVIDLARKIKHPYSLGLALTFAGRIYFCRRDANAVASLAEEIISICREHHFPYYLAQANIQRGWAWTHTGYQSEGIAEMRRGLSGLSATGTTLGKAGALVHLAEAFEVAGHYQDALAVLEEAAECTRRDGSRYWDAEISRLKGALSLSMAPENADAAEAYLGEAIAIARRGKLRSFELRSAVHLGRLWKQQGKTREAHALVSEVYNWFTEGADTFDLQAARTLLEELA